ncbi:MAG: hypothetical protein LEGION0403_FIIPPAGN_01102 [Legionella sp.]|uniref:hypothetical protein n=1 Tax=Legionella sp. TaxID=459 RepID=UPI003D0D045D
MKILIYSGYSNGLGDLSFGKKVSDLIHNQYPDAELVLITSAVSRLKTTLNGLNNVEQFNIQNNVMYIPYDQYITRENTPPDLLIVGPTLNFSANLVISPLVTHKATPILLLTEYSFAGFHMDDLKNDLKELQYTHVKALPTGLGPNEYGIFLDKDAIEFNIEDPKGIESLFTTKLPVTSSFLLGGQSPVAYLNHTNIAVNYSHDNASRFLRVHSLITEANQNTDVIIMGEAKKKDRSTLGRIALELIDKGFGCVMYHEIGQEPEIIAQGNASGPTYRVLHTGRVGVLEASNLRLLGGSFAGATGDQSYSETIASSCMVVYEAQTWKKDFVLGMEAIADQIAPEKYLSRAIKLLSSAQNEEEYQELAALLRQPKIQEQFKTYRTHVIANYNFNQALEKQVAEVRKQLQLNKKADTFLSFGKTLKNSFGRFFHNTQAVAESEKDEEKKEKVSFFKWINKN